MKVKKLKKDEIHQILKIQDWCEYSERFPIANQKGKFGSFELCNLPKLDVLLVVCDCLSVVFDVGEIAMKHADEFDKKPQLILVGENLKFYKDALSKLNFDNEWIEENPNYHEISELSADFFKNQKLGVVSARGNSLRLAQEMAILFPETDITFYETAQKTVAERVFASENLLHGYGTDRIIFNALSAIKEWGISRVALSAEKINEFPFPEGVAHTTAEIEKLLKKYILKGYVYGIYKVALWKDLGIDVEEFHEMLQQRVGDIRGIIVDGKVISEPCAEFTAEKQLRILEAEIERVLNEWIICCKHLFKN